MLFAIRMAMRWLFQELLGSGMKWLHFDVLLANLQVLFGRVLQRPFETSSRCVTIIAIQFRSSDTRIAVSL